MNCPKCGSEMQDNQLFCHNCGAPAVEKYAGEVPMTENIPRCFRWLWIALYLVAEYIGQHISYTDTAVRYSVDRPLKLNSFRSIVIVVLLSSVLLAYSGYSYIKDDVIFGLLIIAFAFYIAISTFYIYRAEKIMKHSVTDSEYLLIEVSTKLLMAVELAGLFLLVGISFLFFAPGGFLGCLVYVAVIGLFTPFAVKRQFLVHRAWQMEDAIPGWLGIFEAKGEARGPEGERYVDRNLSIWCEAHPGFVTLTKDCVSDYSTHCIRLGTSNSPIVPQEYDHILVGPGIVFHIETKAYGGYLKVINEDQWQQYYGRENRYKLIASPYQQALRHDMLLRSIVGKDVVVIPLICMADARIRITNVENAGDIEIVGIASLQKRLSEICNEYSFRCKSGDAGSAERFRLIGLLNEHKVGRMNF